MHTLYSSSPLSYQLTREVCTKLHTFKRERVAKTIGVSFERSSNLATSRLRGIVMSAVDRLETVSRALEKNNGELIRQRIICLS